MEEQFSSIIHGAILDHCHLMNPRIASSHDYQELLLQSM
jgi:alcohol dehydrogenase class IV